MAIGKIESVTALDVIRQASLIIGQSTELAEAIVDAIWLHDVPNWFHLGLRFFPPFRYKSAQLNSGQHTVILPHWWRLCKQLVLYRVLQRREIELVPMRQAQAWSRLTNFKKHLDEELLTSAGLTNSITFSKRLKKLNTDQVYRQHKYNLLHEESEGYSKELQRHNQFNLTSPLRSSPIRCHHR